MAAMQRIPSLMAFALILAFTHVASAASIAIATVDVHTLVEPVQARVKSATGRDLVIAGPVDYKVSLKPTLIASDVTLGNASWGKAPHMLRAKRIELQERLEILRAPKA